MGMFVVDISMVFQTFGSSSDGGAFKNNTFREDITSPYHSLPYVSLWIPLDASLNSHSSLASVLP